MDRETLHFALVPEGEAAVDAAAVRTNALAAKRQEQRVRARQAIDNLGGRATIAELAGALGVSYRVAWALIREMTGAEEIDEIQPAARGRGAPRQAPNYVLRSAQLHENS
jgi:hypothetical protein